MKLLNIKNLLFGFMFIFGVVAPASAQIYYQDSNSYQVDGTPYTINTYTNFDGFAQAGVPLTNAIASGSTVYVRFTISDLVGVAAPYSGSLVVVYDSNTPRNTVGYYEGANITNGVNTLSVSTTGVGTFLLFGSMGWAFGLDSLILSNICIYGPSGGCEVVLAGPSTIDTQASLHNTANYLQGTYALQTLAITSGLTYDCTLFDKSNICVSAGGRYDRVNTGGVNASNGLLVGAYRLSDKVRIGAWVDQNLSVNANNGIQLNNGTPMFGVFGVWNQNASGTGLETKFAAGYGSKDMAVTRQVVGTSEAGFGSTKLSTQGASITVSYNMSVGTMWTASPYAGVRYTRVKANGYTEASDVTAPLTYAALTQESYTALVGLKLMGRLASKVGTFISAGVEQDFRNRGNNYSATGVDGLTDIAFNSNIKKTRPTASLGAWYDIDKAQRISLSGTYRTETFSSVNSLSGMLTYTAGF